MYRKGNNMKGRVKWWSIEKGYGFIEFNDNKNIFAHIDKKENNKYQLEENQEIEFELEENNSGQFIKILSQIEN